MRRRNFITLLGGAAAAWPRAARAQTKRARIGWFTVAPHPYIEGFRRGLKELGWIEGENVVIEHTYADGHPERLPGLALVLARVPYDLVVVSGSDAIVPGTPCNIKGKVLALHGSADPVTPKPMMDAFEEELTKAKVEWQVMMFGGAVHSFCDPTADAGPTRYDEKLCRKSYMLMRDFFAETL